MIVNLLLFILKHNGIHKVKTEENQATLTTDSRSPDLEFDPRTPEYEGLFPQQRYVSTLFRTTTNLCMS
jgi:hypothetical protein